MYWRMMVISTHTYLIEMLYLRLLQALTSEYEVFI